MLPLYKFPLPEAAAAEGCFSRRGVAHPALGYFCQGSLCGRLGSSSLSWHSPLSQATPGSQLVLAPLARADSWTASHPALCSGLGLWASPHQEVQDLGTDRDGIPSLQLLEAAHSPRVLLPTFLLWDMPKAGLCSQLGGLSPSGTCLIKAEAGTGGPWGSPVKFRVILSEWSSVIY